MRRPSFVGRHVQHRGAVLLRQGRDWTIERAGDGTLAAKPLSAKLTGRCGTAWTASLCMGMSNSAATAASRSAVT